MDVEDFVIGLQTKENTMAKESRQRRNERKKPTMTLKERRARKHEKKHPREHIVDNPILDME